MSETESKTYKKLPLQPHPRLKSGTGKGFEAGYYIIPSYRQDETDPLVFEAEYSDHVLFS